MEVLTPVDVNLTSLGLFITVFQPGRLSCLHGVVPRCTFKVQHSLPQLKKAHKLIEKKIEIWLLGL